MRSRAKFWELSNFIVILILGMCLLVPLSYNREKDTFRGTLSFGKYMKTEIVTFYNFVSGGHSSVLQFLFTGHNFYYLTISCDVGLLLVSILLSCCLNLCTPKNNYRSVY